MFNEFSSSFIQIKKSLAHKRIGPDCSALYNQHNKMNAEAIEVFASVMLKKDYTNRICFERKESISSIEKKYEILKFRI